MTIPRQMCLGPRASLPGLRARSSHTSTRPLLQPTYAARWQVPRAWESTKADNDKDGHIETTSNESILWFDNLFPLKLSGLLRAPWYSPEKDVAGLMRRFENSSLGVMDPIKMVKRAIPKDVPAKVSEIIPRLKDGGAFVKFTYSADIAPKDVEGRITKGLQEKPIKPFFSPFRGVQTGLVKGVPWLEDLHRFPKTRLRVEFVSKNPGEEAVELSQEALYSHFRRYGKIAEITSQPSDSKALPKYAHVDFAFVRDAIMARNCLHGYVVPEELGGGKSGTKFRMSYENRVKPHRFWDWVTNHPRIVIPVLVALLTGLTVVIFDPIREFFVKAHVSRKFRLSNNKWYRWLRQQTTDIFTSKRDSSEQKSLDAVWSHRKDLIDQIQKWLLETAETFIVVQGPRGSGKKELVLEQALKNREHVLVIDCKPIVEARGESATIRKLASQVGYRPIFSWANSISSMVDLAVQSTTGVKAGFSETLDSQLQKILHTTAGALQDIDVEHRHKTDSDAGLPDDAYLDAHPEKRAVVVIDNFLYKSDSNTIVFDKIADWAAALVQSNIAHVIFLSDDSSYSKSLTKSLPDRVFRHAALGDLSPEVARRFILGHIDSSTSKKKSYKSANDEKRDKADDEKTQLVAQASSIDLTELDECIGRIGGRLTDLEFLARRLKTGQSPKEAFTEIAEQSAAEILRLFLLPARGPSAGNGDYKWSVEQAWYLVKALSSGTSLRYTEVLISPTFASSTTAPDGESALEGLADAELITIINESPSKGGGRPKKIVPGRPVYQAAFRLLAQRDPTLLARMDLAVLNELIKIETKTIDKAETELALLSGLPKQPAQTTQRVLYLLGRLEKAQVKIEGYEKDIAGLKKVLEKEY